MRIRNKPGAAKRSFKIVLVSLVKATPSLRLIRNDEPVVCDVVMGDVHFEVTNGKPPGRRMDNIGNGIRAASVKARQSSCF